MTRNNKQKKQKKLGLEFLNPRVMLDAAGFVDPVFYGPTPYLSESDLPAGFVTDPDCPDCVVGLETFEDGTLDLGISLSTGQIIGPGFSTGSMNLTDSVDSDDGIIDGSGQTNDGGYSYFTFGNSITVTLPSLMQSAGLVWTDGSTEITDVVFEAFDQDGNSLGVINAGPLADDSFQGTTAEDRFFGISFGNGVDTGVASMTITNVGGDGGLEIDHIHFANCSDCCDDIDLELTKTVDATVVQPGDTVTWTLTIENNAENANTVATTVQVIDVLPDGVTLVSATDTKGVYNDNGVWFIGSIPAGESETLTLVTTVDDDVAPGTMIENIAQVLGATEDDVDSTPNNDDGDQSEDDESSAKITVEGQVVIDLEVTKTVDATTVNAGDTVTWTVTVLNNADNANGAATSVQLVDVLPDGVTLVSVDETKGVYNDNGVWFIGSIDVGVSETLTLVTTVDNDVTDGLMIENVAQVLAANQNDIDSTPNNDDGDQSEDDEAAAKVTVATVVADVVDLELTKSVDVSVVEPGDTVTWTLTIENNADNATVTATTVQVRDVLPPGVTLVSATDTKGIYNDNGVWFIGSIPVGASETLTLVTTVDAGVTDGTIIENVAQVITHNETDVDSSPNNDDGNQSEDDESSALITVGQQDGLMLSGFSYVDTNNDGIFQDIELPLLGVEIQLMGTDNDGNAVNATTFTDINGFYKFNGLAAGDYMVTQVQPVQFLDGQDTVGNLGGSNPENDKLNVTLTANGEEYNFGELGLLPEFTNKRLYLTSTPYSSWEYIDVRETSIWYSFDVEHQSFLDLNATTGSGVAAFMVFDGEMNPVAGGEVAAALADPIQLDEGQYYLQLYGDTIIESLQLEIDTPTVTITENTLVAVGLEGDDEITLTLGHDVHVLNISGLEYEYDASEIDTFHIGASTGNDHVTVIGTDLDDTASVVGDAGHLHSSAYSVNTYSSENTTFVSGGGNDYSQLYGSLSDDHLAALPMDVTLTTPSHVIKMLDFARVDSYGRGGFDYAELYGSMTDDLFVSNDNFSYVSGDGVLSYTKDFERIDGYGRGGIDTAQLFDTAGDDYYFSTADYTVLASGTRINKIKGFENTIATSDNGGNDTAKFVGLLTGNVFSANGETAILERDDAEESTTGFDQVIVVGNEGENPTAAIDAIDFVLTEDADWV